MGSRNPDRRLVGSRLRSVHVSVKGLAGLLSVVRVSRSRMRSFPFRRGLELVDSTAPELLEFLVFQEAGLAQCLIEVLSQAPPLNFTGQPHQAFAKVEGRTFAVKTFQTRH